MIRVAFRTVELQKRYPLAISRGTQSSSENLFVTVSDGEHTGIGELSPSIGFHWTAARGQTQLQALVDSSLLFHAGRGATPSTNGNGSVPSPHDVWAAMREAEIDPPAMAAMDMAIWDLMAKQSGIPLHRFLGLPKRSVPTSVTIGLNPPELTRERVPEILDRTGACSLKIKLGSPEGRDFDKAHFLAAAEAAKPFAPKLRVDANGGWTVDEARMMLTWLAEHKVDYVEQPLPEGQEADLPRIFENRPLPIFIDESCRFSQDIPALVTKVVRAADLKSGLAPIDGINLKLMKCGGITEALRIVATAKAFGLRTMIGCMSESSVAIAAGAAMGALFDHIDLDSHLNLSPDPAGGAPIIDGVITPTDHPGHGAHLLDA